MVGVFFEKPFGFGDGLPIAGGVDPCGEGTDDGVGIARSRGADLLPQRLASA